MISMKLLESREAGGRLYFAPRSLQGVDSTHREKERELFRLARELDLCWV